MKKEENVIRRAEFNPKLKTYFVITGCIALVVSVFGIVLLPIWLPMAFWLANKSFNSLECVLTDKTLRFKKGVLVKIEKTVPLDKITDLGSIQGPLMRAFEIDNLSIETAGGSGAGALVTLPGIVDSDAFKEAVLEQKELLLASHDSGKQIETISHQAPATDLNDEAIVLLREIRDSLRNLEAK